MTRSDFDIVVIGGSSGSIPVLITIVNALPSGFSIPVVIVVHRMKNVKSELKKVLSANRKIFEPEDKEPVKPGCIYLAPQNYHLLVEEDRSFSLDYSETVNYSRPSIDVTFMCMAAVYGRRVLGVLLSGANNDGVEGLKMITDKGGAGIAQAPDSAEYPYMPETAIKEIAAIAIQDPQTIVNTLLSLQPNC